MLLIAFLIGMGSTTLTAQIAQIPFEFKGTHLSIQVKTKASENLNFIFDTGCTGASIDSAAAVKAGISRENTQAVSVAGSGGAQSYQMALHQNLTIDNLEIKDLNLVLMNFSAFSTDVGERLDGIIGYEILNQYVTQIDFDQKKLLFYDQIKSVDTTGYTGIPFEFSRNILIPRFPVAITLANGQTFSGKVMFDTGNAFSLLVSTPFNKFHHFDSKLGQTSLASSRGANAMSQDQLANIKSMSFNGFEFGEMGIRLTVNDKAEPKDGYLGILGMEVIKRFHVILDYAHEKIYLKPNKSFHNFMKMEDFTGKFAQESKTFLEKNKSKAGVISLPSGLQYKIIKKGNGPLPLMEDRVSLHYTTTLVNGQKLWSTYDNNKPWVHRMNKALEGVKDAALMMPVGSKWMVYIPAALAFGDAGYEEIPPGAALIYELEVLKVEK